MTDVKDLLGRAFDDDEPPLGIDRDGVFRAGRQQVRRRHRLAAGGVVAAVVVAVVGAAVLTDFVEITPDKLPPAAEAPPAPPGPELPLTPTSTPAGAPPFTAEQARELTVRLHAFIGRGSAVEWPGESDPRFQVEGPSYQYASDVVLTDGGEGALQVSVSYVPPGTSVACVENGDCVLTDTKGNMVAQTEWTDKGSRERRALAAVILADGTKVTAMSTNLSRRMRDDAKQPSGEPVLGIGALTDLITQARLSVH
jgi:hypothetical protein